MSEKREFDTERIRKAVINLIDLQIQHIGYLAGWEARLYEAAKEYQTSMGQPPMNYERRFDDFNKKVIEVVQELNESKDLVMKATDAKTIVRLVLERRVMETR